MTSKNTFPVLDAVAREHVPEDVNLLPQIMARVEKNRSTMKRKMKVITTLLIVILALVAASTTAYAIYRKMSDTGLQSIQDAGLVKNVNITAKPTLLPTSTLPEATEAASPVGNNSQTLEDVTLTLDWVYLDEGRLALGMKFTPLPADITLDTPIVTFEGVTLLQMQGYSQSLRSDENQAVYVSYQVIQADAVGGKANITVEVPLVKQNGNEQTVLANFHFDIKDVPVLTGQTLPVQQTYAVQRNGVEVRLKSVRVMPSFTEVVACYDFPTQDAPFWYMQHATVQIGDGPEESYRPYQYLSEIKNDHCVKLGFATGNAGGETRLVFRLHQLVVPLTMQDVLPVERINAANQELVQYGIEIKPAPADQTEGPGGWQFVGEPDWGTDPAKDPRLLVLQALEEKMDGPWEFYVDIPTKNLIPGQAVPTPTAVTAALGEQTIEGVTMTLDWVFADARRLAFGYTIFGLPQVADATSLSGNVVFKDANGNPVGGGGRGSPVKWLEGQPGALTGTWSILFKDPLSQPEAQFSLDITLGGGASGDWNYQIAQFEVPASATPFPPGVFPPALPDRLVGTFHFDFKTTVYPEQDLSPNQSVTVNGLEMRLEKVEMTPSYANITLCYQKPSAQDWGVGGLIDRPKLNFAGYEALNSSYGLIFDSDLGGNIGKNATATDAPQIQSGRCVVIDFLLGNSNQPGTATLTIPDLELSMPEVIPDAEVKAAQVKLKAQGIEMDYTTMTSSGGGGGGLVFKVKPEGMTDQEAYQRFVEALGYVVPGPWVFTFEVNP